MKILVVDNDKAFLKYMQDLLTDAGHEVVIIDDGLSALDTLRNFVPHILFVDLVMPNIDGQKVCKIVRNTPHLKDVMVIVLSATVAEQNIDLKQMGAHACIAKGPLEKMTANILKVLQSPKDVTGKVIGTQSVHPRKITGELLAVKRHFEVILERMTEGIIEINAEGRIIYTNPTALEIIQMPEEQLLGMALTELFVEPHRSKVADLLTQQPSCPIKIDFNETLRLNRYDITFDLIPIQAEPATSVIILSDVTDRKQAEKEKSHLEKLQGALEMAGAVCQELTTPMQIISGYSELVLKDLPSNHPLFDKVKTISEQIYKMGATTWKLGWVKNYRTKQSARGRTIIDLDESSENHL
jgi:PAS domain S-box-containing protein